MADPLKVLVIDAGTPKLPAPHAGVNISSEVMRDNTHIHGEVIFSIVSAAKCETFVVDWCNWYDEYDAIKSDVEYLRCLSKVKEYDLVNLSLTRQLPTDLETRIIGDSNETIFVAAAGNEGRNVSDYPAKLSINFPTVYSISAVDDKGIRYPFSNRDINTIDFLGHVSYTNREGKEKVMYGTSVAAAFYTRKIIEETCPSKRRIREVSRRE